MTLFRTPESRAPTWVRVRKFYILLLFISVGIEVTLETLLFFNRPAFKGNVYLWAHSGDWPLMRWGSCAPPAPCAAPCRCLPPAPPATRVSGWEQVHCGSRFLKWFVVRSELRMVDLTWRVPWGWRGSGSTGGGSCSYSWWRVTSAPILCKISIKISLEVHHYKENYIVRRWMIVCLNECIFDPIRWM